MMIHDRHPPPQNRVEPPSGPCLGNSLHFRYCPATTPVCSHVRCHWISGFQVFVWPQANDLCHASFLRLFGATSLTAFRISGFGLLVAMHGCISRVYGQAFVFCRCACTEMPKQGPLGASTRFWGGGGNRVSSSRGAKLHFGAVVVFVCFTCNCIFGCVFLHSQWVVFVVCCKKHVLPLACIFSTDFWAPLFFQWVFFGVVFHTFNWVKFFVVAKGTSYLWVAFFSTDFWGVCCVLCRCFVGQILVLSDIDCGMGYDIWGGGGLGPPPPHPPPSARLLFIGFQKMTTNQNQFLSVQNSHFLNHLF